MFFQNVYFIYHLGGKLSVRYRILHIVFNFIKKEICLGKGVMGNYEAYLRQASYCVLGIMNLGLIQTSGSNFDEAIFLIKTNGFVGMFRRGWTRVIRLVKLAMDSEKYYTKTEFEWEKDFSESFSAEPGKKWIGNHEYIYNLSKLRNLAGPYNEKI